MRNRKSARKQRRTFTLSPEGLAYLAQETRRRGGESQSSVLDEILREKVKEQIVRDYEAQITAYYDSLTDEEREEERGWAQLAEQTLVLNEEELAYAQSTARRNLVHENSRPILRKKEADQ